MNGEEVLELTVGEFSRRIDSAFNKIKFPRLAITGEVRDFRIITGSGNAVFELVQGGERLACFAWARDAKLFPADVIGKTVTATGNVKLNTTRSQYQLTCDKLVLAGDLGALYAKYEALKKKFQTEGLFDEAHKREVPRYPLRVVLVSAERGKGAEDFVTALRRELPWVTLNTIETQVQGKDAHLEIADAVRRAGRNKCDLVVLARGGGSFEDLFPFNEEPVVQAVYTSPVPVVTAIGHTGDQHLADFAADLAFGTPSLAAEFIVKRWQRGRDQLRDFEKRLKGNLESRILRATQLTDRAHERLGSSSRAAMTAIRDRLIQLERRLDRQSPAAQLANRRERLATASVRLNAMHDRALEKPRRKLDERVQMLDNARQNAMRKREELMRRALESLEREDPTRPLERGYAIVTKDGHALRDAADAAPGDAIVARLAHGELDALVERVRQ